MRLKGELGEELAASYLKKQGYKIIKRNYRVPLGEVDIIAEKEGLIIFAEVRTKKKEFWLNPTESVDKRKQTKLRNLAQNYLAEEGITEKQVRFDIIGITEEKGKYLVEHIKDAF